jgi:hypothetical protein
MPEWLLEPPSELLLQPGETARFRLWGAGSRGYLWKWALDGDADAIAIAVEAASPPDPAGEPRGCSVDQIVVVRGLHEGKVRLRLALTRGAAGDSGAAAEYSVAVTVLAQNA